MPQPISPRRILEPLSVPERDEVVSGLWKLVRGDSVRARNAARDIQNWILQFQNGLHQQSRRTGDLLEEAKALALRELGLGDGSTGSESGNVEFEPQILSADEEEWWRQRKNLQEILVAAHTGEYRDSHGHLTRAETVDLRSVTAFQAYSHALRVHPANTTGIRHKAFELAFDPERAVHPCATPGFALWSYVREVVQAPDDAIRTPEEWWEIAFVTLLLLEPGFDPSTVGINFPAWKGSGWFGARRAILELAKKAGELEAEAGFWFEGFWLQATRALKSLSRQCEEVKPNQHGTARGRSSGVKPPPTAAETASSETGAGKFPGQAAGLTPGQRALWEYLHGKCETAEQLAHPEKLDTSGPAIRGLVLDLRRIFGEQAISNRRGFGYFRPDAPPDWSGVRPVKRKRAVRPR
jgi:hypothetical protein